MTGVTQGAYDEELSRLNALIKEAETEGRLRTGRAHKAAKLVLLAKRVDVNKGEPTAASAAGAAAATQPESTSHGGGARDGYRVGAPPPRCDDRLNTGDHWSRFEEAKRRIATG